MSKFEWIFEKVMEAQKKIRNDTPTRKRRFYHRRPKRRADRNKWHHRRKGPGNCRTQIKVRRFAKHIQRIC